jgi:hypothetical protein
MKMQLFRELFELNETFEQVIRGLERLEGVQLFNRELIRYATADVESARENANREFFDNFDDIVENDAVWAYKFQREYNRKIRDPDDIYLEIKDSEERRKKKGLPPRLLILPGWDMSDEEQRRNAKRKAKTLRKEKERSAHDYCSVETEKTELMTKRTGRSSNEIFARYVSRQQKTQQFEG